MSNKRAKQLPMRYTKQQIFEYEKTMHYQLYIWLYCFQNYKMVTVNTKFNIITFLATFSLHKQLSNWQKKFFFLLFHSLYKVKFFFLYLFMLLSILLKNPIISEADECDFLFLFFFPCLLWFWVNSRFTLDVVGVHWIILSVRAVINSLRWMNKHRRRQWSPSQK